MIHLDLEHVGIGWKHQSVSAELHIHSLDILGSVEVRRTRLREACKVEDHLRKIRETLARDNLMREGMMILGNGKK